MGNVTVKALEALFKKTGLKTKESFYKLIRIDSGNGRRLFRGSNKLAVDTLNEYSEKAGFEMNITFIKKENNIKNQNNEKQDPII